MRRKSERTVKSSPTKRAENTPRRTSRRTRKTPEKSINDEESENNSSDQASSSENEAEEIVAPKRSKRTSSRTIEKSSSAEDIKPTTTTTRPRRKAASKKEVDTIEEDPAEADQTATAVSESVENPESASVDSSTEPTTANEGQSDSNQEQTEIKTDDVTHIVDTKENVTVDTNEKESPAETTNAEIEQPQEIPKPAGRRALKRLEKEASPTETVKEVNSTENVTNELSNHESSEIKKSTEDNETNENSEENKIEEKSNSPLPPTQQSESGEDPRENGESKTDVKIITKKQPIVRKRKWLSNKTSAPKVQEITISTDSLKGLISDVKPVPLSDIQLDSSPEADHESDDVKVVSSTSLDYNRRSEERVSESADDTINISTTRKISIVNESDEQQPLSPAKHSPCNILYITNLVRPFTVLQLKSLLQRTGKIVENGFWMDKIKSKCFVKYETEE